MTVNPKREDKRGLGHVTIVGEGNYLGKARRNFYISNRCWQLLHALSLELGLNHSSVLEMAVRAYHQTVIGPVPPVPLRTRRIDERD